MYKYDTIKTQTEPKADGLGLGLDKDMNIGF